MHTTQRSTVVGVFTDRGRAEEAVHALKRSGFADDQIGVVTQRADPAGGISAAGTGARSEEPSVNRATNSRVAEGSAIGAATGAGVGALWALGIAAGMLPAVGWVVGGTLMAVLASAGGLATAGTIVGALVGLGVPEEEARYYEENVRSGNTIVTVRANGRAEEAWSVLHRMGAYNHETQVAHAGSTPRGTL